MRRGVAFVALVTVAIMAPVTAVPARMRMLPQQCGHATRADTPATGLTPVLFVHGFLGSPKGFSKSDGNTPSMNATDVIMIGR